VATCKIMSNVQLLRYRLLSAAYIWEVPVHEIDALQDSYVSTNGDSWEWADTGYQWNFTDPFPCSDSWQGVTCSTDTFDGLLHIFELELSAYSLSGTLPASISNLTELTTLNLGGNELSGKIPDAIGNFSHVTSLVLGSNQLTGTIPATVGYCTQLSLLVFDVNLLTGSIPESIGKCTNLTLLYLGENYLTGSIPDSIGQCKQLTGLYLDSNLLTGALPDSIGQCTALTTVDLYTNLLSGTLPASVGQCTLLTHLYVDFNRLTGTLPSSLSRCTVLSVLALNDNHLSGILPSTLAPTLELLTLSNNHFTGMLSSASLASWNVLEVLQAGNNQFSSSLPTGVPYSNQLTLFDVDANKITGPIPAALEQIPQLALVNVNYNYLTGTLSAKMITGLDGFLIGFECEHNYLTGTLPDLGSNPTSVVLLDLSVNYFSGPVTSGFISALSQIHGLGLDQNMLSGILPQDWSATAATMRALYLNDNHLRGTIPSSLGDLLSLQSLNLSSNGLTGAIPSTFQQHTALQTLMTKNNRLTGGISGLFSPLQANLTVVQLSGNRLTGTLPDVVFLLPSLSSFGAVDNCFDGPLPVEAICSSMSLNSLVLDGLHAAASCSTQRSQLYQGFVLGTLPACLLTMPRLATLHLSGSGLTGSLPAEANISAVLTDLSLSHNLLTGEILSSILSRDWSKLDLSNNRLTGTLHSARAAHHGNASRIYLQHNRLSGVIPGSMQCVGTLSLLENSMFSCRVDRSDVPQQDSDSHMYICGSDSVNGVLYAWLGFAVLLSSALCIAAYRSRNWTITRELRMVLRTDRLSVLSAAAAIYCVAVLLPIYTVLSMHPPTYTYQYAWTLSGAYLSGTTAFAVPGTFLAVLLVLCVVATAWVQDSAVEVAPEHSPTAPLATSTSVDHFERPVASEPTGRTLVVSALFLASSVSIVVVINVAFVVATLNLRGNQLIVIQILLAIFKLGFNNVAVPALRRRVKATYATGNALNAHKLDQMQLLFSLLNVVVIPCLVVAFISPSCFYDALKGTTPVTSSYEYTGSCDLFLLPTGEGAATTIDCLQRGTETDQTSYSPPFVYSYQCSSSFVTYYAPTYVIMCIISAFLLPAQRLLLLWLRGRLQPTSRLYSWVTAATPRILRELPSPQDLARAHSDPLYRPVFDSHKLLMTQLTYLSLLLTFGALFPPLAICCAVAVISLALTARLFLQRYVDAAVAADRQDCLEELRSTCLTAGTAQQLRAALYIVLAVSCVFYTLFLFDTLGDEVGFGGAFWVLIVMPLLPCAICATIVATRRRTPGAAEAVAANGSKAQDTERDVELAGTVGVPVTRAPGATLAGDSSKANNPLHQRMMCREL
jgi:Leucine-rich repeat (LRR) protein